MRYLEKYILEDLESKIVFLGGPRQCGKTTLTKSILDTHFSSGQYFNYDFEAHRKSILKEDWADSDELLIFDEIHKYHKWKNWIKGLYDIKKSLHKFLVTGSARLDVYKKGGDSLLGRYHSWRLHPFSLQEIPEKISPDDALKRLLTVGGFPEPFLNGTDRFAKRWRKTRNDLILKEDIRDLEPIKNFSALQLFAESLKSRVGSLLVLSNLASDMQISPHTLKHWLEILERMYLLFPVYPLSRGVSRAILKTPKIYFFDNGDVEGDEGSIFENLVATHLLKKIQFLEDRDGTRYSLHYIRDKEKREIDFAIVRDKKLEELIEVKLSDTAISKNLLYYSERLKPEKSTQIVLDKIRPFTKNGIRVTNVIDYFNVSLR